MSKLGMAGILAGILAGSLAGVVAVMAATVVGSFAQPFWSRPLDDHRAVPRRRALELIIARKDFPARDVKELIAAYHRAETERWWPIVRASNLKAE